MACDAVLAGVIQRGRGGDSAPGIFSTRKFHTGFISHSGLKIEPEKSHASRIFYPQEVPA